MCINTKKIVSEDNVYNSEDDYIEDVSDLQSGGEDSENTEDSFGDEDSTN